MYSETKSFIYLVGQSVYLKDLYLILESFSAYDKPITQKMELYDV